MTDWVTISAKDYRKLISYVNSEDRGELVSVVRCKDCKYGVPTKNGFLDDMIACENKDSPCGYSSWVCQLDWFCADGERREMQDVLQSD